MIWLIFLKRDLLIYLLVSKRDWQREGQQRETERSSHWFFPYMAGSRPGQNQGPRTPLCLPHVWLGLQHFCCCLLRHVSRELYQKWSSRTQISAYMGCPYLKQYRLLLYHNANPNTIIWTHRDTQPLGHEKIFLTVNQRMWEPHVWMFCFP